MNLPFSSFTLSSLELRVSLAALISCLHCRSSGSSKSWKNLSLSSRAWRSLPGQPQAKQPSKGRGRKERSQRQHPYPLREVLSPMTASLPPGPMKSVSHDLRNNFLDNLLKGQKSSLGQGQGRL